MNKIADMLTQKEVLELTGFKRSTMYNYISELGFPKPKDLGGRMARWSKKEILMWFKNKGFDVTEELKAKK